MRKKIIRSLALLSISLSACSLPPEEATSFSINDWSPKIIDQNLNEVDESFYNVKFNNYVKKTISKNELNYNIHTEKGLLIIGDKNTELTFYSLLIGKELLPTIPWSTNYDYIIHENYYVGFDLTIYKDHVYTCYDGYGNIIYSNSDNIKKVTYDKDPETNKLYCKVYNNEVDFVTYEYMSNGKLNTEAIIDNKYNIGNKYEDLNLTNKYEGLEIDGYNFSLNLPNITVYKDNGKCKASYSLPYMLENTSSYYLADTSLIYQINQIIAPDSEDYDCYSSLSSTSAKQKIKISTYKLDLLTGKNKEIKTNYILLDKGTVYKDKNGKTKYSLISAAIINKDKTISNYGEFLMDGNGKIVTNATGFAPTSFIKLENGNYYNLETKILYNSKLQVISNLNAIKPTYVKGIGFIGVKDKKYGVINENGVISLGFEYDEIYKYSYKNKIFAVKENYIYSIDLNTNISLSLIHKDKFYSYNQGLFLLQDDTKIYSIWDVSSKIFEVNIQSSDFDYLFSNQFAFGTHSVFISSDILSNEVVYHCVF